ncbi:MAG: tRNA pseudouridine(55) synthase TruB [Acetatifactor sp.]|nr:tRNA pseudouridine(55) synthase TruB [Acetatifactor sp.]MDE7043512.1 tRNA pseudouridine(55) synthase TruB [Acetatifactor sp.]
MEKKLNGIIIIDKEPDYTSADVVAKMRGICGQKKVGHTGTLDPAATGVLPICLGSGTKLCGLLTDKDKEYVAELLLGVETDTQDTTGRVLAEYSVAVSEEDVRAACMSFVGGYSQIPPMYSALKVNGKRLYELAREGREVERRARPVVIRELEILELRMPVVKIRVVCSKGTYIRTLCADIGAKLGCGGTMQSLRRTRVGMFGLEQAVTLGRLQELKDTGRLSEAVHPVESCFRECPVLHVSEEAVRLLENGNAIYPDQTGEKRVCGPREWVRFHRPDGSFAGIYAYEEAEQRYKPVKMFLEKE